MERRELFREALLGTDAVVQQVAAADLGRPTPCAGWVLADLLAHMVGQQDGFAAAVSDGDAPPSAYAPVPFSPPAWRVSTDRLLQAFDEADLEAEVIEIEFSPRPLRVDVLLGAQLLDAAVHGWDVARSLGRDHAPSRAVVDAVAEVARGIADDDRRATAGFFGPAIGETEVSTWDGVLAHLGRDPGWQPPS